MSTKLIIQSIGTFFIGSSMPGLLLFLPAGTFDYRQAWVFILIFMITFSVFGIYFSVKDPELIERCKQAGPAAEQSVLHKVLSTIALTSLPSAHHSHP